MASENSYLYKNDIIKKLYKYTFKIDEFFKKYFQIMPFTAIDEKKIFI